MCYYGYIEGYYGRILSWEQRRGILSSLEANGLNCYLFGAKEDYYHRIGWRDIPDNDYQGELKKTIKYANDKNIEFIPAIAPGLSYKFGSSEDKKCLITRLENFCKLGAKTISILMDDIPLELPKGVVDGSCSLAEAQAKLLNEIVSLFPTVEILFCPTLYTDELLGTSKESDSYLEVLSELLDSSVKLFWTGENTVSKTISKETLSYVYKHFDNRVIIWDNYYCNDYATSRLFLSPLESRDQSFIQKETSGLMLNLTGLYETDKFLVTLYGMWYKNKVVDWLQISKKFIIPESFIQFLPWFYSPFSQGSYSDLKKFSKEPMDFFNEIIVNWQSPMKLEWYPYLHSFFSELRLASGKWEGKKEWYKMRYLSYTYEKLVI